MAFQSLNTHHLKKHRFVNLLAGFSHSDNRLTMHLLSIERADWPKLHDMFKARDATAWQREFLVGFPVSVCASNLLLINICHDFVARIESRHVMKAKQALSVCWFVRLFRWKNCNFSREKIERNNRSTWHVFFLNDNVCFKSLFNYSTKSAVSFWKGICVFWNT